MSPGQPPRKAKAPAFYDVNHVLKLLRARINEFENKTAYALHVGLTPDNLSHVTSGRKPIPKKILRDLGLEPVVVRRYRRISSDSRP